MKSGVLGADYYLETGRILNQSGDFEGALNEYIHAENAKVLEARLYIMDFFQQLHLNSRGDWAKDLAPRVLSLYPNDEELKNIVLWK